MRNPIFDIMKGIGIIAVIIGHLSDVPYMPWRQICFSFHMPLFFLLSGYFYKQNYDIRSDVAKSARRLLIPYVFTAIILGLPEMGGVIIGKKDILDILKFAATAMFASGSKHHSYLLADFRSIGAIWFLFALFWCKITYNVIAQKSQYKYLVTSLIAIVATIIDYYLINLPFAILPGLSAMMYFEIGNYMKEKTIPKWILLISLILYPVSFYFCRIFMVQCHYDIYPLAIIGSCGGVYIVYELSKYIGEHTQLLSKLLQYIGSLSIVILCVHLVELRWDVYHRLNLPSFIPIQVAVRVLIPILVSVICIRFSFFRKIFQIKI